MPLRSSAEIVTPSGQLGIGGGGGSGGSIPLMSQWRPELSRMPAVSPSGPLVADSGILSGDLPTSSAPPLLNQTGMRFIPWNAVDSINAQPLFNYQGMVPAPAPTGIQAAAGRTCLLNACTPRFFNGNAGQYYNGNQSIRVGVAGQKVVFVFYVGQGQITATGIDNHIMVEHEGENKHLNSSNSATDGLPRNVSGGSGVYRRELTHIDHRYREHRLIMGANCYFIGMWVETLSTIQRPKNRPQCFVAGVDSWNDALTWFSSPGYAWPRGDWQCLPPCVVGSFYTGMAGGTDAQGGTGEYNPNGTPGGDLATYNGNRSSAAWSDSRVNWRVNWWSSQFPIFLDIGGWNDGSLMTTPYQSTYKARVAARVQKTVDRCTALGRPTRFVNVGIEPANISGTTDPKWLASLGQAEVPSLFPGVVLGHVPLMPMWPDSSTTGPRALYCNDSDKIHTVACGDDAVMGYITDAMGKFSIDEAYTVRTALANVPIVNVPTS
jgi:hypothetical protein